MLGGNDRVGLYALTFPIRARNQVGYASRWHIECEVLAYSMLKGRVRSAGGYFPDNGRALHVL